MIQLHRMLYDLISGLKKWEENMKEVPEQLWNGFQLFIQQCSRFDVIPPSNLADFIKRLQMPVKKWGFSEIEQFIPLDARLIDQDIGVSIDAEEFIDSSVVPSEYEQSMIKQILLYCREYDLDDEYRRIRIFLANPKHAVVTRQQLYSFLGDINDKDLAKLFIKCYEEIQEINRYRKCTHCGWTLHSQQGVWRCNKENVCQRYGSGKEPQTFPDEKAIYYRLTSGIQRYTLIPGMAENSIANKLENKGYQITMYPEVDLYDILVKNGNRSIKIDVKDYRQPFYLARYIEQKMMESNWNKDVWYVVPQRHIKDTPLYIERVYHHLNDWHIRILSEQQLLNKVGELLHENVST